MDFKQQIAKYVSGKLTTDQLPDIGVSGLAEGLASSSLGILAGLCKNEPPDQIAHYFKRTLEELSIKLPDARQAAITYALAVVNEILTGEKDIISGTRELYYDALGSYDFFSENKSYCYDSIG